MTERTPREILEGYRYYVNGELVDVSKLVLKELAEWVRSKSKGADKFTQTDRKRLLAVGWNMAVESLAKSMEEEA